AHGYSGRFWTFRKAWIRDVEKLHQSARIDDIDDTIPLRRREVDAGRIVAARVQDRKCPGREILQSRQHRVEIEAMGRCVVVGVGVDRKSRVFKYGPVIFPARITDPELGAGIKPPQKIDADFKPAGAAQSLHRYDASAAQDV